MANSARCIFLSSTRSAPDGRLIRFRTECVVTDPQAKIIGISVDDATLWRS